MMNSVSAPGGGGERAVRRIGGRHQRHQRRAAVGMADREGGRRQRPGRAADHRDLVDAEGIEEIDEGVGLVLRRRVGGKGRAEIAEARRGDHVVAGLDQAMRRS